MRTNYTPGPWAIAPGVDRRVHLINDRKGGAIGEIVYADTRNPADARLIAAAPDLLATLRELVQYVRDEFSCSHPLTEAADRAHAAIARATGGDA